MEKRVKRPLEAVYNDHFSYVYNAVYMHVLNREKAEDLTSEIFIRIVASYHLYDPERTSERTWINSITNHLLIDHYRAAARNRVDLVEDELLTAIPCHDAALEKVCDTANEAARMLLAELDPQERHLLEMRYLMDMKNPQIADALGINAKAVCERLRRLTEKCKKIALQKGLQDWL